MAESKNFIIKTYSKSEIASHYNVSLGLLSKWLVETGKVFTIEYYNSIKIFTPKDVKKIVDHLGEP